MAKFTDGQGGEWPVTLNVAAIKRVRELAGVDLLKDQGFEAIPKILQDDILLGEIAYAICRPIATERDIDAEAFENLLWGDTLSSVATAVLEALRDFFPSPKQREDFGLIVKKTRDQIAAAQGLLSKKLADGTFDREMDEELKKVEQEIDEQLGRSSTSAPGSPE